MHYMTMSFKQVNINQRVQSTHIEVQRYAIHFKIVNLIIPYPLKWNHSFYVERHACISLWLVFVYLSEK